MLCIQFPLKLLILTLDFVNKRSVSTGTALGPRLIIDMMARPHSNICTCAIIIGAAIIYPLAVRVRRPSVVRHLEGIDTNGGMRQEGRSPDIISLAACGAWHMIHQRSFIG